MRLLKGKNIFGEDFRELIYHSKNYISAQFFSAGLAFLTLPIFTKLMPPSEYGVMSVFTSFLGILTIIFGFGFRGAITRYYYEDKLDFWEFFNSNFWFLLIADILLIGLALQFQNQLTSFLNIPKGMIFIAFGIVVPQVLFQIYQAYLQAAKNSKRIASLNVIQGLIGTGLAILIMYNMKDERYYGKGFGQGFATITMFIVALYFLKKNLKFSIKKKHLKYSILFGIPIVFHLLSQNILSTFDQVIINQLVGGRETGLYAVAYKVGMVQNMISMGILQSWTPIFYDKLNKKKYSDINSLAKKYGFIVMLVAVSLIFFSKEIIIILVNKRYFEALSMVPIIIVSYFFFFLYTMYVNYAFYYKKTKNIALFTIIAGGVNILLNYLLIPKYGYFAAAWVTLISYALLFGLHYFNVKIVLKVKNAVSIKVFIYPIVILGTVSFIHYFLMICDFKYLISLIIRIGILLIILVLSYRKFKPEMK